MNPSPPVGAQTAVSNSATALDTQSPAQVSPAPKRQTGSRLQALSAPLTLVGVGLVASTYVYLNNPNNVGSIFPKCPLKHLTGLDCPGCGLTRSVYSLFHGDILAAISHNLLVLFVVPWLVMALVRWTAQRLGYEVPKLFTVRPWMLPATVILLTIFTVGRNLPIGPLRWFNSGYAGV